MSSSAWRASAAASGLTASRALASSPDSSGSETKSSRSLMRVISNTRWTVSVPLTSDEAAARFARTHVSEHNQPQPAGVHELELAEVEHERAQLRLGRQAVELVLEQGGAGQVEFAGRGDDGDGPVPRRLEVEVGHRRAASLNLWRAGRLCGNDTTAPIRLLRPRDPRRGRGRGFEYLDDDGDRVDDPEDARADPRARRSRPPGRTSGSARAERPPAGDGIDAAGRKQYLYHAQWRVRRDAEKFDDMARFARALPGLREQVEDDLDGDGFTRERVLACAVRLLDRGFFRIGSEEYTVQNESFGLATMRKSHVTIGADGAMEFDYPAKSGQRRVQAVVDPQAGEIVAALKRRRGGGDELLAYKEGRRWRDMRSEDVNAYIKDVTGDDFSAKDFRTWNATVLAAVALAVAGAVAGTPTGRKRAISRAIKEVAHYLGNTPAVCRASYIDPRVFDAYNAGLVIGRAAAATRRTWSRASCRSTTARSRRRCST